MIHTGNFVRSGEPRASDFTKVLQTSTFVEFTAAERAGSHEIPPAVGTAALPYPAQLKSVPALTSEARR